MTTNSDIDSFFCLYGPLTDAMFLVSAEGSVLAMNEAAQSLLGIAASSGDSSTPLSQLVLDAPEKLQRYLELCAGSRKMVSEVLTFQHASGPLSCRVEGMLLPGSARPGLLLFHCHGHSRVQPEPPAQRAEQHLETELAIQRESLRVTLASISDAVIATGTTGHITFMNPVAERLTGFASSEAVGHVLPEILRLLHGETRQPARALLAHILKDRDAAELAAYTLLVARDGSEHPVESSAAPIRDRAGAAAGAVLILRDLGPRREAERLGKELLIREQAIREQAEHANQIKDEFLAVLSHELRTPLSAITGWVQLLQQQQLGAEQVARGLEVIERNVRAQTQLINDLLDVSRILSGKLNLDYRPVELVSVIFTAIDSVELAATKKGITLRANLDKEASLVQGDSIRLQQVIWNLLQNSIKFTPSGGWIEVRLEREGTSVRVTVKDSGAGIAPEFLPSLFERFRQADSTMTRRHGGLGLGLALVREIIELHGGTVQADSPGTDKGTTMTLRIPQRTAPLAKNERPQNRTKISAPSLIPLNQLAGLSILLVEDDPDSREIIRFAMQSYGAEVREASSVAEAKEQLRQRVPDVLVSDIGLPEEDGFALIRYVRKLRPAQGSKVPALALTAFARHVDAERALSEGFDQHLAKPALPATLVEVVANLAGRTGHG